MTDSEAVDFATVLLRSLPVLVPVGTTESDLAIELGLTAFMRGEGLATDETIDRMWIIREVLIDVGELDRPTEPTPFRGGSGKTDLVHLTVYLGALLRRAAQNLGCDVEAVIDVAVSRPDVGLIRFSHQQHQRRSS